MNTQKIGFIGGGNMASSLISGLIASGHEPEQIWVSDPQPDNRQRLAAQLRIHTTDDNLEVVNAVDVIVLAVKPQILKTVAQQLADVTQNRKLLVVSIAAGITQNSLANWLGSNVAIVRCMPNTPALVRSGATALHANPNVNAHQKDLAENILRSVGISLWVESEPDLDAVTAISGSGPAYFFLLMEAMEKAALELGLSTQTAQLLIQQTALGAAKIALESDETPEQLRLRVTSPGGTTEQAIRSLQQDDFTSLVTKALQAARNRSIEISRELGD
jgi:pyrroline-5-carboxylate reductase